ncbi:MAG: hypothetical protein ACFBSE_23315 [Prochloraceae cyanobacterium]
MSEIEVIGGEIILGKWHTSFLFLDHFPEIVIQIGEDLKKLNLNNIKSAEIINQEDIKSLASSAGWGLAAGMATGLFTGGLGFIVGGVAGAVSKGKKTEVTFMCELEDGRKFIATTNSKTWKRILALTITPKEKRLKPKVDTSKIPHI